MSEVKAFLRYAAFPLSATAVLSLMALLITAPVLLTGSWYDSHDGIRLPYLLHHFTDAFTAGIWYPRWLPDMMSGYGYPTFIFYQPGYFYFSMPFALFFDPLRAVYISLFAMLLLSGAGAYKLARYYNTPWVSLLLACVFLLHQYLARNIYVRGAYPEAYAQLLLPWATYFALRFTDEVRQAGAHLKHFAAAVVLSCAILIITHPYIALFFLPFVGGLLLLRSFTPGYSRDVLAGSALVLALVVVITIPYWLTLFELKELVKYHMSVSGGFNPIYSVMPKEAVFNFSPTRALGVSKLLALTGFICAWRNITLRYVAAYFFFLLFMISDASFSFWYVGNELLKYVQFPWRLNAVLGTVGFLGIVQLGPYLKKAWQWNALVGYTLAACLIAWVLYTASGPFRIRSVLKEVVVPVLPQAMFWSVFDTGGGLPRMNYYKVIKEYEAHGKLSMSAGNEFMPKTARSKQLPNRLTEHVPVMELHDAYKDSGAAEITFEPDTTRYEYYANVKVNDTAAIIINQFYFPGWKVSIDGKPVEWTDRPRDMKLMKAGLPDSLKGEGAYDDNGRMLLYFDTPGTYRVYAHYDGPPGWMLRNAIVIAVSALLIGLFYKVVANKRAKPYNSGDAGDQSSLAP